MIIRTISLSIAMFSSIACAETLDEFFLKYPDLQANTEARTAIKSAASSMATSEAIDEGNKQPGSRGAQLMRESGGEYARLAVRQLAIECNNDSYSFRTKDMSKETCGLLTTYSKAGMDKEVVDNGRAVLHALIDAVKKSCLLVGEGKDKEALASINDANFPGGKKNPVKMGKKDFDGLKGYFMQYRNLDDAHCGEYAKDFVIGSLTNQY